MTFTPIDELPPPPAWMVEDAEKADLAEAHSLLPQLWTIREFRKIALPIVLGVKSKTGLIMREAIIGVEKNIQLFIEKFGMPSNFQEKSPFVFKIFTYSKKCWVMGEAADVFKRKQLEKFVAFKNGKVPKNRANAVKNVANYWKPRQGITENRYYDRSFETEHPESWLDAYGIPRNREGLTFNGYGGVRSVYGALYIKHKHFTMWDMLEYWKKNFKYAEPGLIVGWNRKIREKVCVIF